MKQSHQRADGISVKLEIFVLFTEVKTLKKDQIQYQTSYINDIFDGEHKNIF